MKKSFNIDLVQHMEYGMKRRGEGWVLLRGRRGFYGLCGYKRGYLGYIIKFWNEETNFFI